MWEWDSAGIRLTGEVSGQESDWPLGSSRVLLPIKRESTGPIKTLGFYYRSSGFRLHPRNGRPVPWVLCWVNGLGVQSGLMWL